MKMKYKDYFGKYEDGFQQKITNILYRFYVKNRRKFISIKPLKTHEELFLRERLFFKDQSDDVPTGYNYDKNQVEKPYINLEYIDIVDYIPKEKLTKFKKEIKKYSKSHKSGLPIFDVRDINGQINFISKLNSYESFSSIGTFAVDKTDPMFEFITGFEISLHNLSNTFCAVKYRCHINKEINVKYNKIINSYYKSEITPHKLYSKPWHKISFYSLSMSTGNQTRKKTLYLYTAQIKWQLIKHITRNFTTYFSRDKLAFPIFETYSTNIRPKIERMDDFWESVPFGNEVDYSFEYNSCICMNPNGFEDDENTIIAYCGGSYKNENFGPGIFMYDISDSYIAYLAAEGMNQVLSNNTERYNTEISNAITKPTTMRLLKKRMNMKKDLFYSYRFACEFDGNSLDYSYNNTLKNGYNDFSFKKIYFDECVKKTHQNKYNVDNLLDLLNTLTEYSSGRANFMLQVIMAIITVLSLVVAIIAIKQSNIQSIEGINTLITNLL
ncbi:MAG: hypothetical protein ACI37Z_01495 [Candidatus Gastranaerophilaceae bacterium]